MRFQELAQKKSSSAYCCYVQQGSFFCLPFMIGHALPKDHEEIKIGCFVKKTGM